MLHRISISETATAYFRAMAALLCLFTISCGGGSDSSEETITPGGTSDTLAIVNTKGDGEANISIIDYATGVAYNDLLPVGGSWSCDMTQYQEYVYIVDKSYDRIVKFNPATRSVTAELSVGANASPNSIVFASATKA